VVADALKLLAASRKLFESKARVMLVLLTDDGAIPSLRRGQGEAEEDEMRSLRSPLHDAGFVEIADEHAQLPRRGRSVLGVDQ
jgi:hypothetical protein